MPIPAIVGAIAAIVGAVASATSAGIGIANSRRAAKESDRTGMIKASLRETQGIQEIEELERRMVFSGVEVEDPNAARGSTRIRWSSLKELKKTGELMQGVRDYSGVTDTASLLLGTSRDAIRLDADAIRQNAESMATAYNWEAIGKGVQATGQAANFFTPGSDGKSQFDVMIDLIGEV